MHDGIDAGFDPVLPSRLASANLVAKHGAANRLPNRGRLSFDPGPVISATPETQM